MKLFRLCTIAICALALCTISCSDGEDGTDGIDGINGEKGKNGSNGTNGVNGQNGQDGVGFDELTRFGDITIQLVGNRPDGKEFSDSRTFKFTPVEADAISYSNSLTYNGNPNSLEFEFRRFYANPDNDYQDNYIDFYILVDNPGEEDEFVQVAELSLRNHTIIGDDGKFFEISEKFKLGDIVVVPAFEFSDMAFDPDTNHLSFAYRLLVTGDGNNSENDLTISGEVDVTLLEQISQ
ncbi:hypothetical protein LV716_03840 [Flagellimonas sp. HMM57]|uniref:collagen-like protein n=1 Tax=unclassified Flagellimonas TaxID=2644544 RepID=UPI0013D3DC71|nr:MULTISPECIES: collagen-like protein [unclassified Flagellimonas]UII76929.1 hypothetical protein LV716_03840 [Flagellimonas sp. HMM57]